MSSKTALPPLGIGSLILALALTLGACGHERASAQDGEPADTETVRLRQEYALARAHMELARGEQTYLEIDGAGSELHLRVKGAIVFSAPITFLPEDSGSAGDLINDFIEDLFTDDQVISFVRERYLYSHSQTIPDSVLAIISDATGAAPELLQRYLPERFIIEWEGGVVLDVRTTAEGKPVSTFSNIMTEIRQVIKRPFSSHLVVLMDTDDALTLFNVCEPGTPTVVTLGE